MKKRVFILISVLIVIAGIAALNIRTSKSRQKEVEQLKLEHSYEYQNTAFEVVGDYTQRIYYHGADELNLQNVLVNLYVFNHDQSEYTVTIDEVVDYFSEEYDSDGSLKIYSCSENINQYILWYYKDGQKKISDFKVKLNSFLEKQDSPLYWDLSPEEVTEAIAQYEAQL